MDRKNSEFFHAIDALHMPKEQHEQIKEKLLSNYDKKVYRKSLPAWRRYAVTAAIVLCLIVIPITVSAGIYFKGLAGFFSNSKENSGMLKKLSQYATTEKAIAENEDYRLTIINNLYSEEQQMGILVCSFKIMSGDGYMTLGIPTEYSGNIEDVSALITKDEITTYTSDAELGRYVMINDNLEYENDYDDFENELNFSVEADKLKSASNSSFSMNEQWKDGGCLIGIRYGFDTDKDIDIKAEPQLILEKGENEVLKLKIPESEDFETITLTSKDMKDDRVIISPIGIKMISKSREAVEDTFDSIYYNSQIIYKNGDKVKFADIEAATAGVMGYSQVTGDACGWCYSQIPLELIDVENIESIQTDFGEFVR